MQEFSLKQLMVKFIKTRQSLAFVMIMTKPI